jgi:GNAT superfamily N-acetyltransferase
MPTSADLLVRSASSGDHAAAVEVLVDALRRSAVLQWVEPDPERAVQLLYSSVGALLEHTAVHGTIRIAEADGTPVGVAVWFPYPLDPGATDVHDIVPAGTDGMLFTDNALRLGRLTQSLKRRHPVTPHYYLACLGVCASRQNLGIGTALLTDHRSGMDHLRTLAYLEAYDRRTHALYRRLGYMHDGRSVTVDGCPPIQPMSYQPASATN